METRKTKPSVSTKLIETLLILATAVFVNVLVFGGSEPDFSTTGTVTDKSTGVAGRISFLGGNVYTYYNLDVQYHNPNDDTYNIVTVSVSSDEYERYSVGNEYALSIHRAANLIPVDKRHTSPANIGTVDALPQVIFAISLIFVSVSLYQIWVKK